MKRKDRGNSILEIRHTEGIVAVKLFSIKKIKLPFPTYSFSLNHVATSQESPFFFFLRY